MEMAHADADLAVARAAASLGVPYTLSNQASFPMEDVAAAAPDGSRLFQLYWSASDELNASLLRRAEASGCEAIVVTLDTHLLGWRTRDLDLAYLPFTRGMGIAQYTSDPVFQQLVRERVRASTGAADATGRRDAPPPVQDHPEDGRRRRQDRPQGRRRSPVPGLRDSLRSPLPRAAVETFLDVFSTPALTWDDLAKAREWTSLPIILKGILHPDDAVAGAGCRSRRRVGVQPRRPPDRPVRADARRPARRGRSGRRAGARRVRLGRARRGRRVHRARARRDRRRRSAAPTPTGSAIAGEAGVREVVRNLLAELDITLGLSGHTAIADVGRDALRAA